MTQNEAMSTYADDGDGPELLQLLQELDSVESVLQAFDQDVSDECACRGLQIRPQESRTTVDGTLHGYWECLPAGDGPDAPRE